MNDVPYKDFGVFLSSLRNAKGWLQQEFAARTGVTQQTVSRWERGLSRPRPKEIALIATLLSADLKAMEVAAGYTLAGKQLVVAPTFDVQLPLQFLQPESFENFCLDLLARYYRPLAGVANRFGGTGSKQYGIDIEVRGQVFVHTFQCKRVDEFGEKKVHAAVAEHKCNSNLKVLLLSNIASPKARMAISQHAGWQMWDRVDISAKFRELSMVDRRDLVDIYFRGQRQPILGEPESGPFQAPDDFFKGFVDSSRYFNHSWTLVNRDEELTQLLASVLDDGTLVTMLLGAPGNGKTRLLRELVEKVRQKRSDIAIRFVSLTEDVKAQHLEELGVGAKLLVIDDAHDRDDLARLMKYASAPENNARLLLSLRPYGRAMVRHQATLVAMDSPQVSTVELRVRTKQDALALATQVLETCRGTLEAAEDIAELTYLTPLVTVLAAQIVAKEKVPLALIGNSENFQAHILARLEKIVAGQIVTGTDVPKLQAVLRMVALLQPIVFDDPAFLNILREVDDLEQEDAQRLLRLLSEGGVLFKRGLRYRLAPDLLADSIIQRNFISVNGVLTQKAKQVFELADTEYLKHLLVNLGRLDWRLRSGNTEGGRLLSSFIPKLKWHGDYYNPHIEAVEAVAYYQPRLALGFAEKLISQGHGDKPGVCGMIRNAAFNLDLLEEACVLLWRAGKGDARSLHQHSGHGIRILKELAEFAPNKPVECVERVVTFAIDLLERPATLTGGYTPFTILEGPLRTDMETMTSNNRSLTITRYRLNFELTKTVRRQVIDIIVNSLQGDNLRKAYLAAGLLSEALRGPMHGTDDAHEWDAERVNVLERVCHALETSNVHPVILVKMAMSVSWHAFYNRESACVSQAKFILAQLNRDLPTRFVRLIADAWGGDTWEDDDSCKRKAHQADTVRFIAELSSEFPQAEHLYEFLEYWLSEIDEVAGQGWGSSQIFINRLIHNRRDLASVVMEKLADTPSPLSKFAGAALAELMLDQNRQVLISKLLEDNSVHSWELISEAYARQTSDFFTDVDIPLVRRILQSREPTVVRNGAFIVHQIAKSAPALAVELTCIADLTISPAATHDFFMWLVHSDTIPIEVIAPDQWVRLLNGISQISELEDHWVYKFIEKAVVVAPAAVIEMLKIRLKRGEHSFRYRAFRRDETDGGLALSSHPAGSRLLREFLEWAVGIQVDNKLTMDIGACVFGLCGKYGREVRDVLLEFMRGGSQAHVNVVASVLRSAHQEFVIDETSFVKEVLSQAELISARAVSDISSALWSSAFAGVRSGEVGEPFKEDVALYEHSKNVLIDLSKMDPVHQLYSEFFRQAKESIERQAGEKRTIEDEEE